MKALKQKKEAGVFYTPEDVAGYILRNTISPFLLDFVQANYPDALSWEVEASKLLRQNPDRYISLGIKTGVGENLPPEIEAGIFDIGQREGWNSGASQEIGLPGETWRDVLVRRKRYAETRNKLINGEIRQAEDFIIYDLDLALFMEDLLQNPPDPELLEAFACAIEQTTILDPTCGEGVFLIEALAILSPVYELCLKGMANFVEDTQQQEKEVLYSGFAARLAEADPYKSIAFYASCYIAHNNLFGIDIMPQAVETAKQRIQLALLDPLTDIAAFRSLPDLAYNLKVDDFLSPFPENKGRPGRHDVVNRSGLDFLGKESGFAVIVGNPPYVELSQLEDLPDLTGMQTASCGNIYALVLEQSARLCRAGGRMGMVMPLGAFATSRMVPLQDFLLKNFSPLVLSFYSSAGHPSVLFEDVKYRLAIMLGKREEVGERQVFTSAYMRWKMQERPFLFSRISYRRCPYSSGSLRFARLGTDVAYGIMEKMLAKKELLRTLVKKNGRHSIYYQRGPVYWVRVTDFVPYFEGGNGANSRSHLEELRFENHETSFATGALLSSSFFYFWFISQGNCRDLTRDDVFNFPVGQLLPRLSLELARAFFYLVVDLREHSGRGTYRSQGSGQVEFDTFYPRLSRSFIQSIDRLLAQHFGLTGEELDFLLNYDFKYRVKP